VNWKGIFIAGLLLSASPFNLSIGEYSFFYSSLGFGLIALSYLFKKMRLADYLSLGLSLILIVSSVFNVFEYYFTFQMLFYGFTGSDFLFKSAREGCFNFAGIVSSISAVIIIIFTPFILAMKIINDLGFGSFIKIFEITVFVLPVLCCLVVFGFIDKSLQ